MVVIAKGANARACDCGRVTRVQFALSLPDSRNTGDSVGFLCVRWSQGVILTSLLRHDSSSRVTAAKIGEIFPQKIKDAYTVKQRGYPADTVDGDFHALLTCANLCRSWGA